jgi:hypothetical protein
VPAILGWDLYPSRRGSIFNIWATDVLRPRNGSVNGAASISDWDWVLLSILLPRVLDAGCVYKWAQGTAFNYKARFVSAFASCLSGGGEWTPLRGEVKNSHSTSEIPSPDRVGALLGRNGGAGATRRPGQEVSVS